MNKIMEKVLTVLNHALIDLDTIDKLTDRHGYHRFNLLRGELTELKTELDRIESEKPDICKTDCEFYEGCLETFTHKKSEKPDEDALEMVTLWVLNHSMKYETGHDANEDLARQIGQFAERYHQSRREEKK